MKRIKYNIAWTLFFVSSFITIGYFGMAMVGEVKESKLNTTLVCTLGILTLFAFGEWVLREKKGGGHELND